MAIQHANPADVVDVCPLGPDLATTRTRTLFKTEQVEVIRIVMAAGKEIAQHKAPGEIIIHCLEGAFAFDISGKTVKLRSGQLLYLTSKEPHAVRCIEDGSFLLTIALQR